MDEEEKMDEEDEIKIEESTDLYKNKSSPFEKEIKSCNNE